MIYGFSSALSALCSEVLSLLPSMKSYLFNKHDIAHVFPVFRPYIYLTLQVQLLCFLCYVQIESFNFRNNNLKLVIIIISLWLRWIKENREVSSLSGIHSGAKRRIPGMSVLYKFLALNQPSRTILIIFRAIKGHDLKYHLQLTWIHQRRKES